MKHKNKMGIISLFALLLVAIFSSNRAMAVELDTVWVSDFYSDIRFQHPVSKNIIISNGAIIRELDSKDGKLVKEIEFGNESKLDLTPDGTKLLSSVSNDTYIYDYNSMELIVKLDSSLFSKFLGNDEVVFRKLNSINLIKYNLITKEKQIYTPDGSLLDIATSHDGRFIALSTNDIPGSNEDWTKLILVDAKTMKQIKQLEENKNTGHHYERLNFSKDGKYLTYSSQLYNEDFQRNVYNTETFKVVKNINSSNLKADNLEVKLLNDNIFYIVISEYDKVNFKYTYKTQLRDLTTEKILITLNDTYGCQFNNELNHLYYKDSKNKKIICLNISNLNTGVTLPQPNNMINYQNKQLIINKENVIKVEISDISGRLIMNKIIENPFSNNIVLPLNLANGSYLINVITEKESFTHKLMVME